jgi:hypothetical protein
VQAVIHAGGLDSLAEGDHHIIALDDLAGVVF